MRQVWNKLTVKWYIANYFTGSVSIIYQTSDCNSSGDFFKQKSANIHMRDCIAHNN